MLSAGSRLTSSLFKFPDDFLWGTATSAFQVEGHPGEIEARSSDWSVWTQESGRIQDMTSADSACEFFYRYEKDIALCKSLNMNAFRLGLNWSALCPSRAYASSFEPRALNYYRKILEHLKQEGMTTFVTLFHFCLPQWLADSGGWLNPATADAFEQYSKEAARQFGDLVDYWTTINEPMVYVYQGYVSGLWPPGEKQNYAHSFKALREILRGHALSYWAIKKICPEAQISVTKHWRPFSCRQWMNPFNQMARFLRDRCFNHVYLQAIEKGSLDFPFPLTVLKEIRDLCGPIEGLKGTLDYLAINYYAREICEFRWQWPFDFFGQESDYREFKTNDLGWEIWPEGLYFLLTEDLAPYRYDSSGNRRKIFITENGYASRYEANLDEGDWSLADRERSMYLVSHLMAVYRAIEDGANVHGYLHWSLLDNFEWAEGLSARFGLVRVSYPTQERNPRQSANVYAKIAGQNGLNQEDLSIIDDISG